MFPCCRCSRSVRMTIPLRAATPATVFRYSRIFAYRPLRSISSGYNIGPRRQFPTSACGAFASLPTSSLIRHPSLHEKQTRMLVADDSSGTQTHVADDGSARASRMSRVFCLALLSYKMQFSVIGDGKRHPIVDVRDFLRRNDGIQMCVCRGWDS
jgi:hypothetical protein